MLEHVILSNLVYNEQYGAKVFPFLKTEYFHSFEDATVFDLISNYVNKYNSFPSKDALLVDLSNLKTLKEPQFKRTIDIIDGLEIGEKTDPKWLLDTTEKFCKDKAVHNALRTAIEIEQGEHKTLDKGSIPSLLSNALAVSFDNHIGHDYDEDWAIRWQKYHEPQERIPFDVEVLNKISRGGFPKSTCNVWVAGPGVGKSLVMCHQAATARKLGKNVLYFTMEMSEVGDPSIGQRIDANLLDLPILEVLELSKEELGTRLQAFGERHPVGKLIIKEFPMATAGANHFRHIMNELRMKKGFIPDVVFVDYLGICVSTRMKADSGLYSYVKAIGEELRGMAQEFGICLITAAQFNRQGSSSSDPDMGDLADSFGTAMTGDFVCGIFQPEEMIDLDQYVFKQFKNRYTDKNWIASFVVGVDKSRMRIYDVEDDAQTIRPTSGLSFKEEKITPKLTKERFAGFS